MVYSHFKNTPFPRRTLFMHIQKEIINLVLSNLDNRKYNGGNIWSGYDFLNFKYS